MGKSFSFLLISLLYLTLFFQGNCIIIKMDERKPFCIKKNLFPNEHLTINYLVTGDGESQVKMEIFKSKKSDKKNPLTSTRNPKAVFTIDGKNEFEYKLSTDIPENYEICFHNQDHKHKVKAKINKFSIKVLLFDFLVEKHKDKSPQDDMNEALSLMSRSLKNANKIQKNQYSQFLRDMVHHKKIDTTEKKIKWCAVTKILILVVLALAQIFVVTSFFKKKNNEINPGI